MDFSILDDATLWVAVSFILFIMLVFKPLKNQLSEALEKKIDDLKKEIDESKKLKAEAENIFREQKNKQEENLKKIQQIKNDTMQQILEINKTINEEIKIALKRKENNFIQISSQMERKILEEIRTEILKKTIFYTEHRLKNKLTEKHNSKLIDDSLKKLTQHFS
jgi:F-type H+-transporting ATPase subunit b|tara:strand:+ start:340 stop:834 length:495 start_codon:yes stop_codon:yes gene_type:complete